MLFVLKRNLELAQERMKLQADKRRNERHFEVGDWVYLRLVPYQLQSLAPHSNHKLQPRFFGPYEIVEKIGIVAYKLDLPPGTKVHPVFHVSCLKKHLSPTTTPSSVVPVITDDGLCHLEPAAILERRMYKKGNSAEVQLLVHWKGNSSPIRHSHHRPRLRLNRSLIEPITHEGFLKVNADGTWCSERKIGCVGMVVRDDQGDLLQPKRADLNIYFLRFKLRLWRLEKVWRWLRRDL